MKKNTIVSTLLILISVAGVLGWWVLSDNSATSNPALDDQTQAIDINATKEPVEDVTKDIVEDVSSDKDDGPSIVVEDVEFEPQDEEEIEVNLFPVTTNHYKITKADKSYEIELYAIINKPDQYDEYVEQLKTYKQEALNYLIDNEVDVQSALINYTPSEAANL